MTILMNKYVKDEANDDTDALGPLRPHARVREQRQSEKNREQRREVVRFISSLEQRVQEFMRDNQHLQRTDLNLQLQHFINFQNQASEYRTFLIIIERRLEKLATEDKKELSEQFDDLVIAVWGIAMSGALTALAAIAQDEDLPLGSRELFVRELITLNDAKARLDDERYQSRIGDKIRKEIQVAERILNEIIDKAPSLLSF